MGEHAHGGTLREGGATRAVDAAVEAARVFERARQGDRAASGATSGLGLGLAIADHIVSLHGGSIDAESGGLGCGSTFRVVFTQRSPAASAVRD